MDGELRCEKLQCDQCQRIQVGFIIPDGRWICPQCSPPAVHERWRQEWEVIEKERRKIADKRRKTIEKKRVQKEKDRQKKIKEKVSRRRSENEKQSENIEQDYLPPLTEVPVSRQLIALLLLPVFLIGILFIMALAWPIGLIIIILTDVWVMVDAMNIKAGKGSGKGIVAASPLLWLVACVFLWIYFFPLYLLSRPFIKESVKGAGLFTEDIPRKPCPECGELVAKLAKKCRFCGFWFAKKEGAESQGASNNPIRVVPRE